MTDREALQQIHAIAAAQLGQPVTTPLPPVDTQPTPTPPTLPPGGSVGNPRLIDLGGRGNNIRAALGNGEVVYTPLPVNPDGGHSGTIIMGEVPGTPQPRHMEACISRTIGLIDPASSNCAAVDGQMSQAWLTQPTPPDRGGNSIDTAAKAKAAGYLWAPPSEGPWYLNMRATFNGSQGEFLLGWNNGPY